MWTLLHLLSPLTAAGDRWWCPSPQMTVRPPPAVPAAQQCHRGAGPRRRRNAPRRPAGTTQRPGNTKRPPTALTAAAAAAAAAMAPGQRTPGGGASGPTRCGMTGAGRSLGAVAATARARGQGSAASDQTGAPARLARLRHPGPVMGRTGRARPRRRGRRRARCSGTQRRAPTSWSCGRRKWWGCLSNLMERLFAGCRQCSAMPPACGAVGSQRHIVPGAGHASSKVHLLRQYSSMPCDNRERRVFAPKTQKV